MRDDQAQIISPLTFAEIDLKAIRHNLREIRRLSSQNKFSLPYRKNLKAVDILAVVKADGYGHGMQEVSGLLAKEGVNFFAVSDVSEGICLRKTGIKKPILLLESPLPAQAKLIGDYDLTPTVCSLELALALEKSAWEKRKNITIHVKVDTGMGRFGVWHAQAFSFIQKLFRFKHLIIQGIYTHFPVADVDQAFTKRQIEYLYALVTQLDQKGLIIPTIHAANSMGLAGYKTHILNLARPGLMLYGLYPKNSLKRKLHLKPALSVKSKVIFLKNIEKGRSISYGRTFIAKRRMRVATIPIGYNDGYLRCFSNKSFVLIQGQRCPVLGRVTMDQIVVDVSSLKDLRLAAEVVILGIQGKETITADKLAQYAQTINYEIVCHLGNRLPRRYV